MSRPFGLVFAIGWTLAAIFAMGWGTTYNWPDYVHVTYGFPLSWANHTLDTIAGPVDKWHLDYGALGADLLFWLGLLAVVVSAFLLRRRSKKPPTRSYSGQANSSSEVMCSWWRV